MKRRLSAAEVRIHDGKVSNLATRVLRADAFTLGRRVFLSRHSARLLTERGPEGEALLAHEMAHVEQFRRLGVLPFLIRYVGEYQHGRRRGRDHAQAYTQISFEREAREKELSASSFQLSAGRLENGARGHEFAPPSG